MDTARMISIPQQLIEQYERGNVLLFVGEQIDRDAEGMTVDDQLAMRLVARIDVDETEDCAFVELAQIYEDEMGRHALVRFVREQLEAMGDAPSKVHRLIAELNQEVEFEALVTTGLDRRLERAFEESGHPLEVIVGDVDVAFQNEDRTQLYKLRGSVERAESLVLTEADHEDFFDRQESIAISLQAYLVQKTVVFVGYDLADEHFKRLYRKVTNPLDTYARKAYAFGAAPSSRILRWCKRNRIEVIDVGPTAYLEALAQELTSRARSARVGQRMRIEQQTTPSLEQAPNPASEQLVTAQHGQPSLPIPERPYKLLDSYGAKDEAIFFGREWETTRFTSMIHAHRLALLYGASGTGKTSLLQAGVLPRLERADPPYETITVRALDDPALVIRRTCQRRLPKGNLPQDGSLLELLTAVCDEVGRHVVIILDQFEEFFVRFSPQHRAAFIEDLGMLYDAQDVPVKIVFSLREDWLASMSEIESRIPEVFRSKMRLQPLSRAQAREAITKPVAQLEMRYEPQLVERLLDDLADEKPFEGAANESAAVMPPHLQLVCDALFDRARADGRDTIGMADYEFMGGARDILARYIDDALQEHPSEERDVAKRVLVSLVTSQDTKNAADQNAIAAEVGVEQEVVERVLVRLVSQRLVRRTVDDRGYELAHDILAEEIAGWVGEEERQIKQAREMLRRELADWQRDTSIFLSQTKLQRIYSLREIMSFSDEETAFLLRAAVLYDENVAYWLERVGERDIRAQILLEMLGSESPRARATAAAHLARFPVDGVAMALARNALEDTHRKVQDAAAVSLGRLGGQAGVQVLADIAADTGDSRSAAAVRALALVRDVAPDVTPDMDGSTRRRVSRELARMRLRRDWPKIRSVTYSGAVGGAIAYGLGLALPLILHEGQVLSGGGSPLDLIFISPFIAAFGLLAGAFLGFGTTAGESLFARSPNRGRVAGGAALGGLGFALALLPLAIVYPTGLPADALKIVGGGLFGVLVGLGLTLSGLISPRQVGSLIGGAAGGAIGIIAWGVMGMKPFQSGAVPGPLLALFGAVVGLIMAYSVSRAERRWPEEDIQGEHSQARSPLPDAVAETAAGT
jgi:hypothetical protein